ncbi:MAG: cytochrome c oxidase accessory protein CcoG [Burkholderiales bacterium]
MPTATDTTATIGRNTTDDSSVAVVSLYKKQIKIYPRAVRGWFASWRWALVWATQLVFYGLPWLTWNDRPTVLFDLAARRFFIGPLVLYPQDFIYLTGLLILSAYALFLFTAVAGRLWCGYACPQTVYTELFMWVEHHLEGDRAARMKLDAAPWSVNKLLRKGGKQAIWLLMGLFTGFTFVGYFTPIHTLAQEAATSLGLAAGTVGLGPWETFWILFYGFATYGNAGYMREQVCKYMCPYARFQSAMFDKDTLIVSYDGKRGEPRGSRPRSADPKALGKGDCIDCGLCVQVCPTGIDIRNGLQYECIGCAACVDVCNGVMEKMNYPPGLIRLDTQNSMAQGWSRAQVLGRIFRPRVLIYSAVLLLIGGAFIASLLTRTPFRVDVVRDRGTLARVVDEGSIENVYRLQVMNAREVDASFRVSVAGLNGLKVVSEPDVTVPATQSRWLPVRVQLPFAAAAALSPAAYPVEFLIESVSTDREIPRQVVHEKSTFVLPR